MVYSVYAPYFQSWQFNIRREQVNSLIIVQDTLEDIDGIIVNNVLHDGGERRGKSSSQL